MAIYFKEQFKQNRRAKDLTQEQLAEIFHVSPQAISRWETGATCPDIELLPSIASFFNITVDALLGVDNTKNRNRLEKIRSELKHAWEHGHIDSAIEILRNATREFPCEYAIQHNLAMTLMQKAVAETNEETKKINVHEAIAICERMLKNCIDDNVRNSTLFTLSQSYKIAGDKDKAVAVAKNLSYAASSNDVLLTTIYEGDELHEQLKKNHLTFTHLLADSISQLARAMYETGSREKISLIIKAIDIYSIIYENGDYGFGHFDLSLLYCELAKNYYLISNMDNTLDCLEKAAQHAISFDTPGDLDNHTSIAVQGMQKSIVLIRDESSKNNHCYEILHGHLGQGNFKLLENDERYVAVVCRLGKHAELY